MADKVIFEMLAERVNNQYLFRISHPQEGINVNFRVDGSYKPVSRKRVRKEMGLFRNRRMSEKARRDFRRTLSFYEELYSQLFGGQDVGNLSIEHEE